MQTCMTRKYIILKDIHAHTAQDGNEPFPSWQETVKHVPFSHWLSFCTPSLHVCLTLTQQKLLLLNLAKSKSTTGRQRWADYHRGIKKRQRNTMHTHNDTYKGWMAVNKQTWPLGQPAFCWIFGVQRVWQHTFFCEQERRVGCCLVRMCFGVMIAQIWMFCVSLILSRIIQKVIDRFS